MLTTVVLDHELQLRIGKVEPFRHRTPGVKHDVVDHWLGQPGEHHQQPEPRLHRRVDADPNQTGCPPSRSASLALPAQGGLDELSRPGSALPDQRVAQHHKVDEGELGGKVDESLCRAGDPEPAEDDDLGPHGALVTADTLAGGSCGSARAADMGQRLVGHDAVPDLGCGLVACVRTDGADPQGGRRTQHRRYGYVGAHVDVVEQSAEPTRCHMLDRYAGAPGVSATEGFAHVELCPV